MNFSLSTGNEIVDKLSTISIMGNITPHIWYKTLKKEKTNKPYLHAIVILSDIVYWYRPEEKRDEQTGQFIGYKKKFKADLLQRNYKYFSDMFGISEKEGQRALAFLEGKKIIKRIFRKLDVNGKVLNNVMYIELNVEELKKITFPFTKENENVKENKQEDGKFKEEDSKGEDTLDKLSTKLSTSDTPMDKNVHTLWTNSSIPYGQECPDKYIDYNTKDYNTNHSDQSKKNEEVNELERIEKEVEQQIEYDILHERFMDEKILENIKNVMCDVLMSPEEFIRVNKEQKNASVVKSTFRKLDCLDVQEVIWTIEKYEKPIKNLKAWIITLLYNQKITGGVKSRNFFNTSYKYNNWEDE